MSQKHVRFNETVIIHHLPFEDRLNHYFLDSIRERMGMELLRKKLNKISSQKIPGRPYTLDERLQQIREENLTTTVTSVCATVSKTDSDDLKKSFATTQSQINTTEFNLDSENINTNSYNAKNLSFKDKINTDESSDSEEDSEFEEELNINESSDSEDETSTDEDPDYEEEIDTEEDSDLEIVFTE